MLSAWVPSRVDNDLQLKARSMSDSSALPEDTPALSIVIPLLNEEAVLEQTYARLKNQLDQLGHSYELVFVDDGSTDRTRVVLAEIARRDSAVRVVVLSRNFGHEMATTAGLQHARGQAAIVMDADLQDPPELLPEFVKKWREGYQVVYGVRQERRGEPVLKKITSYVFYRLLRRLTDVPIPADTGDFRLVDRRVLDVYRQFHDDPRFFRGLISWIGFRQIGIPFIRHGRAGGQTKYRFERLLRLALDTITAFSTLPSLYISLLAGLIASLSLVLALLITALWLCRVIAVEGWVWAALAFLGLWNLQFLGLAVLGEYVVRTHRQTLRRPLFVVEALIENASQSPERLPARTMEPEATLVCRPSALCRQ
jgi:dolichol-phosphate mannosyltransferase